MAPIPGVTSVFDYQDPYQTSPNDWSSWADSLTPASSVGYQHSLAQGYPTPAIGYGNSDRDTGVYFDPSYDKSGTSYGNYNVDYGASLINAQIDAYNQKAHPELYSGFNYGGNSNAGQATDLGGDDWKNVDRWDSQIKAAVTKVAQQTGVYVPVNLVKAIMQEESGGDPTALGSTGDPATASQGAYGLMQIMPGVWGTNAWGLDMHDPAQNIELGVNILVQNYNQGQPDDPTKKSWEWATKRYLGLGGADANGTTADGYWNAVNNYWSRLTSTGTTPSQGGSVPAGTTQLGTTWGGFDAPITGGFNANPVPTDFSGVTGELTDDQKKHQALYNYNKYTSDFTANGQVVTSPGLDVGLAYGTHIYAPIAGVVKLVGGNQFCDAQNGCGNNIGELVITAPNGDQVVLGYMSQILKSDGTPFKVGDTVNAGDFLGYSGAQGGEATGSTSSNLHMEYRRYLGANGAGSGQNQTESGYLLIDPQQALAQNFTGTLGASAGAAPQYAANPGDWESFMEAGAKGTLLSNSAPGVGGWHDWLLGAMKGTLPGTGSTSQNPTHWAWAGGSPVTGGGTAGGTGGTGGMTGGFGTSSKMANLFGPGANVQDWGAFDVESSNGLYDYGKQYGLDGTAHTGDDVVVPYGTSYKAAFSGTVVCAGTGNGPGVPGDDGGCAAFEDELGPGAGRVEVLSDDGNTAIIYGHSSVSLFSAGQHVNAGDVIGKSGGENSAHVHVEVRVKDPSMPSGWKIVDPMTYIS